MSRHPWHAAPCRNLRSFGLAGSCWAQTGSLEHSSPKHLRPASYFRQYASYLTPGKMAASGQSRRFETRRPSGSGSNVAFDLPFATLPPDRPEFQKGRIL